MSFFLYDTQAEAQADADVINQIYLNTIQDVRNKLPVNPRITIAWSYPIECEEGWAFPRPPDGLADLITSRTEVEEITRIESK